MNARKYFLNEYILPNAVVGSYNIVDNVFSEPFISLNDLVYGLQTKVNETACEILNSPSEGEKHDSEIAWKVLYNLLTEIQKL